MANNVSVKDSGDNAKVFKTTDNTSVHTPHYNLDAIAAGASADIGAVADSAVVTDTTGSLSGKLRGLIKWAFERMPAALGQATMSASLPVVIASNQSPLQLTGGSASIGGVKDNGVQWTPIQLAAAGATVNITPLSITNAPASGKAIIINDLLITVAADMVLTVREVSGANLFVFQAKAGAPFVFAPRDGIRASVNKQIEISSGGAGQVYTFCSWQEV